MTSAIRHDPLLRPRHVVTAVLVAHDGARWLPTTLHAVKAQRRPVQRFVAVDTGSRDETAELLERAVGASSVLSAPRSSGFSAAAHLAVSAFAKAPGLASPEAGTPVEWIWLLHDDSAPSPAALERLLALAEELPSAAVIGPKLLDWDDHRTLLEVGVTIDRGGRRETGLEPGELDHGQHDGDRDVLAVSTAGMLVRRDVWEHLGGLDRALPLFRDDLDFGWRATLAGHRVVICTSAVVYHAQAAASGQRAIDVGSRYRRRLDRRAALRTMLANTSAPWLVWIAPRLLLACLVRALALLLLKRPFDAWDELRAAASVFGRPRELLAARAFRRAARLGRHGGGARGGHGAARSPRGGNDARAARSLFAPRGARLRHYAEAASQRLAVIGGAREDEGPDADRRGLTRRIVTAPGVVLIVGLLVVALIAERHVLGSAVYGGALLPAPSGASDLWRTYTQSWHPTGFGSTAVAPPYLAFVAMLATVLFGSARLAVGVLVLGAVPLAGLTAYVAAKPIAPASRVRVWVAATYALLPVATGAVASGRLGVCVVVVMVPIVLATLGRALVPLLSGGPLATRLAARRAGRRPAALRPAWAASIPLTIAGAFDPILYLLLAPVIVIALVVGAVRRSWLAVARAVMVLAVPPVLLLPWTARLWHHPALVVTGVGDVSPDLQTRSLAPIDVLLLHPGGPGMPPIWLDIVVVLAALAGLLQLTRLGPALLGWLLALIGLVGGVVLIHLSVTPPGAVARGVGTAVPGWPGTATALMGAGFLMSAAVAGARLRARLATTSFGWRQPLAVVLAAAAVLTPVAAAALWLARGAGPELRSGDPEVLPAFIQDPQATHDQPRTVVLRPPASDGTVSYALLRDRSPELGDADLPPDPAQVALVDDAVADLVSGGGGQAAIELSHVGVRYVLVPVKNDGGLGFQIAEAGGLVPKATDARWRVWQVEPSAGRLAVASAGSDEWQALDDARGEIVGRHAKPVSIPYSPTAQRLVLAEAPSSRWRASSVDSDGGKTPLPATTTNGMQSFVLPTTGADVVVFRAPDRRADWLVFELVAGLVVLAAAIPAGRRAADQRAARAGSPASLSPPARPHDDEVGAML